LKNQPAARMFNSRSPSVKALGINPETLSEAEMIDLMVDEPRLIKRPVVRIDETAYFGADRRVLEGLLK